jgi:hypothetical protein
MAKDKIVQRRLMPSHEEGERVPIAALEAAHQRFVGRFAA